jgi:hypothetical protein
MNICGGEVSKIGFVAPGISFPTHSPQNKDTTTTASSDEIIPEITPETSRFDSDSDKNSLTSIAEALGQHSELHDAEEMSSKHK